MNNPICPVCQAPMQAQGALPFAGGLAIILECEYWHQSVNWLLRNRFTLTFDEVDNGSIFVLNGCQWMKTRPWGSEGFNASYRGGNEPPALFIKVLANQEVLYV